MTPAGPWAQPRAGFPVSSAQPGLCCTGTASGAPAASRAPVPPARGAGDLWGSALLPGGLSEPPLWLWSCRDARKGSGAGVAGRSSHPWRFWGASEQGVLMMQLDKTIHSDKTSSLGSQLCISAAGPSRDGWGSCLLCCSWSKSRVGGSGSSCISSWALPGEQGGTVLLAPRGDQLGSDPTHSLPTTPGTVPFPPHTRSCHSQGSAGTQDLSWAGINSMCPGPQVGINPI